MDYAIPSYIFTCPTEAGVVVLDARHGKYSLVRSDRARYLEGAVRGWPILPKAQTVGADVADPAKLLDSLVRGGIIVPAAQALLPMQGRAPLVVAPASLLDALAVRDRPKVLWRHVVAFSLSVAYASVMLKRRPFNALLYDLQRKKERRATLLQSPPIAKIREYVRIFSWLRPFAYAESDACLFDSVALTNFLYRQGVSAQFCIGVRVQPFIAHSWVQSRGFAFNELPDYLAAYTPILSV
jgi:hypothetical protein